MDTDSNPPKKIEKPPAHVFSDKEFDERFNQVFVTNKRTNNFYANRLGAIGSIELPGTWTERTRNKQIGIARANAFVQKDKVVSHRTNLFNAKPLLSLLMETPHELSKSEFDSLGSIAVKGNNIVSAKTIDIKGRRVLEVYTEDPAFGSDISFYFAAGKLFPGSAEMLSFTSPGKFASIQNDVDLAKKTWRWNLERFI